MKLPDFITNDETLKANCIFCGSALTQQIRLNEGLWNHKDFICSACPQPDHINRYIDNYEVTYRDVNNISEGKTYTLDMVFIRFSEFTLDILYQSQLTLIFDRECDCVLGEIPTVEWDIYNLQELEKQIKLRLAFS